MNKDVYIYYIRLSNVLKETKNILTEGENF